MSAAKRTFTAAVRAVQIQQKTNRQMRSAIYMVSYIKNLLTTSYLFDFYILAIMFLKRHRMQLTESKH